MGAYTVRFLTKSLPPRGRWPAQRDGGSAGLKSYQERMKSLSASTVSKLCEGSRPFRSSRLR